MGRGSAPRVPSWFRDPQPRGRAAQAAGSGASLSARVEEGGVLSSSPAWRVGDARCRGGNAPRRPVSPDAPDCGCGPEVKASAHAERNCAPPHLRAVLPAFLSQQRLSWTGRHRSAERPEHRQAGERHTCSLRATENLRVALCSSPRYHQRGRAKGRGWRVMTAAGGTGRTGIRRRGRLSRNLRELRPVRLAGPDLPAHEEKEAAGTLPRGCTPSAASLGESRGSATWRRR